MEGQQQEVILSESFILHYTVNGEDFEGSITCDVAIANVLNSKLGSSFNNYYDFGNSKLIIKSKYYSIDNILTKIKQSTENMEIVSEFSETQLYCPQEEVNAYFRREPFSRIEGDAYLTTGSVPTVFFEPVNFATTPRQSIQESRSIESEMIKQTKSLPAGDMPLSVKVSPYSTYREEGDFATSRDPLAGDISERENELHEHSLENSANYQKFCYCCLSYCILFSTVYPLQGLNKLGGCLEGEMRKPKRGCEYFTAISSCTIGVFDIVPRVTIAIPVSIALCALISEDVYKLGIIATNSKIMRCYNYTKSKVPSPCLFCLPHFAPQTPPSSLQNMA